jgi:hypothetical protein
MAARNSLQNFWICNNIKGRYNLDKTAVATGQIKQVVFKTHIEEPMHIPKSTVSTF